jgi:hypothetical protein
VNVTVPERDEAPLALADTVTVAPDVPEVGDTDSHDALEEADHDVAFVMGTTDAVPLTWAGAVQDVRDRTKVNAAPWDTDNVAVAPPAVNVTTPERGAPVVFAPAVNVTPTPDDPDVRDSDSHHAFDDAVHDEAFVVGTTTTCPPPTGAAHDGCDNVNDDGTEGAGWVTVNVARAAPAANVNTPDRDTVPVFAVQLAVTLAPDTPDAGDALNHVALDDTDHDD